MMVIVPFTGGKNAESVRSRVDLPAPLGPSRQVSWPLFMVAFMLRATTVTLFRLRYPVLSDSILIVGLLI